MKKNIYYILVFIVIIFIGNRIYWYLKEENNLIFFISNNKNWINENDTNAVAFKIFIDDQLIYNNDSISGFYNFAGTKVKMGRHKLIVSVDSLFTKERYIYIYPIKWVTIEYPHNNDDILITTYDSPPQLE